MEVDDVSCCGGDTDHAELYDNATQICCDTHVFDEGHRKGNSYLSAEHICCISIEGMFSWERYADSREGLYACCDETPYRKETRLCCPDGTIRDDLTPGIQATTRGREITVRQGNPDIQGTEETTSIQSATRRKRENKDTWHGTNRNGTKEYDA